MNVKPYSSVSFNVLTIFFVFINCFAFSQEQAEVRGVLVGSQMEPLEFIHVYLGGGIGTFTNQNGQFELVFPLDKQNDSITFSAIGFKKVKYLVSELSDTIMLSSSLTVLKELVITPKKNDGRAIMEMAINSIPKNYPNRKYSMKAFYRESNIKGNQYGRMFESYALLSGKGFFNSSSKMKFKILQLRKTVNNLDLTIREKNEVYQASNGLYRTLKHDRVMLKRGETLYETFEYYHELRWDNINRYYDKEFLEGNDFTIVNLFINDGDTIAELSSKSIAVNKALRNNNKIYINLTNYAIVKYIVNYTLFPDEKEEDNLSVVNEDGETFFYKAQVIYKKIGDRYFPHYYKVSSFGTNSNLLINRWRRDNPSGRDVIYQHNEMFITDILPYVNIKKNEAIGKDQDIYNLDIPNDTSFWRRFSFPGNYLVSKKAQKELSGGHNGIESLFIQ